METVNDIDKKMMIWYKDDQLGLLLSHAIHWSKKPSGVTDSHLEIDFFMHITGEQRSVATQIILYGDWDEDFNYGTAWYDVSDMMQQST